jgi:hypothetical protein
MGSSLLRGVLDMLRPELWNVLFSSYEQATGSDRRFLENLEAQLKSLVVTPLPSGRDIKFTHAFAPEIIGD